MEITNPCLCNKAIDLIAFKHQELCKSRSYEFIRRNSKGDSLCRSRCLCSLLFNPSRAFLESRYLARHRVFCSVTTRIGPEHSSPIRKSNGEQIHVVTRQMFIKSPAHLYSIKMVEKPSKCCLHAHELTLSLFSELSW